eukprot:TRINITY_DN14089_c0_g1_i1.p1 TRINITY_DN14089_c0_g1~~TRINITY_DN14089_c0_g1_i1.p1  ORF type:complete len:430 (+),score=86.88 TRINITY_DN14089_c0_g1_i1:68-1291(+)
MGGKLSRPDFEAKPTIVVIGGVSGSHFVRTLLSTIAPGTVNVKLIDRRDYFEVPIATLRGLVDDGISVTSRMHFSEHNDPALGLEFIKGEIASLDEKSVSLVSSEIIPFDYLVIASGSSYHGSHAFVKTDVQGHAVTTDLAARYAQILADRNALRATRSVAVIGGGAVGIELAGELTDPAFRPEPGVRRAVTLYHAHDRLAAHMDPKVSRLTMDSFQALGVDVQLNKRVKVSEDGKSVILADGTVLHYDAVIVCGGVSPNTKFVTQSSWLDAKGFVNVDKTMRVVDTVTGRPLKNIFSIGDCCNWGRKEAYLANMQGDVAVENVKRLLKARFTHDAAEPQLKRLDSGRVMGLLTIGRAHSVFQLMIVARFLGFLKQKDFMIGRTMKSLFNRAPMTEQEAQTPLAISA